jgi:hypothetical protein
VVFELSCWLYWLRIWSQNSGHGWIVANSYILVKLLFLCSLVHALSIGLSWNWIMLEAIGCLVCLCILAPWVLSDLFKACRMYLYVVLHYCTVVTGKFPTALQLHARLFEGSECLSNRWDPMILLVSVFTLPEKSHIEIIMSLINHITTDMMTD